MKTRPDFQIMVPRPDLRGIPDGLGYDCARRRWVRPGQPMNEPDTKSSLLIRILRRLIALN